MFETNSAAALYNHFTSEDVSYWSYIGLATNNHWFLVKISSNKTEDGFSYSPTMLLTLEKQLEELANRDDLKIVEAHIVTPSHMLKNQKTWAMYKLSKVLKGTHQKKNMKSPIFKFELSNGEELIENLWGEKLPKGINFETIFEASRD